MSHLTRMIRFVRHWHARIGVVAAVFFLTLALTGLALNHTDTLALDKKQVRSAWLMSWYGLHSNLPQEAFLLDQGYFVGNSQAWVMDGHALTPAGDAVVGVTETQGLRYVATSLAIHMYDLDGRLVDTLPATELSLGRIDRVGVDGALVVVQAPGLTLATPDGLEWQPHASQTVRWSQAQPVPAGIVREAEAFFAPALPLERILLDVHSGRLFGKQGPLVMDVAALLLIALSISGLWIYFRTVRRKHG